MPCGVTAVLAYYSVGVGALILALALIAVGVWVTR